MAKLFAGKKKKKLTASDHGDMENFEPIPTSWVEAQIEESDYVETTSKEKKESGGKPDGHMAKLTVVVIDKKFRGRKIWHNVLLDNPNPKTTSDAEKELATICRAIGIPSCDDTTQLHKKPMLVHVGQVPEQNGFPAKNKITGYKKLDGLASPAGKGKDKDKDKKSKSKSKPFEDKKKKEKNKKKSKNKYQVINNNNI